LPRYGGALAEDLQPAVTARRGRVVKMMDEGALVESGLVSAVECAAAIQGALSERDLALVSPIQFGTGIKLGRVIVEGDHIMTMPTST